MKLIQLMDSQNSFDYKLSRPLPIRPSSFALTLSAQSPAL